MVSLQDFSNKIPKVKKEEDYGEPRFYDFINSLFTKQSVEAPRRISSFVLLHAISMDPSLLLLCSRLAKYKDLDFDFFVKVLRAALPRRNGGFGFFKYLKKKEIEHMKVLELVSGHFHTNQVGGSTILEILGNQGIGIAELETFFGVNK